MPRRLESNIEYIYMYGPLLPMLHAAFRWPIRRKGWAPGVRPDFVDSIQARSLRVKRMSKHTCVIFGTR